jgi:hypothetical protein
MESRGIELRWQFLNNEKKGIMRCKEDFGYDLK